MAMTDSKRLPERDGEHAEGSLAFQVFKPIDLAALDADFRTEHPDLAFTGMVAEGDLAAASKDEPVIVWALLGEGASINANDFRSVVSSNDIPEDPMAPIIDKARAGEDLTPDEMQQALRALLTR